MLNNIEQSRAEKTPEGPLLFSANERTMTHMLGDGTSGQRRGCVVSRKGHRKSVAICWGVGATLVKNYRAKHISDSQIY